MLIALYIQGIPDESGRRIGTRYKTCFSFTQQPTLSAM